MRTRDNEYQIKQINRKNISDEMDKLGRYNIPEEYAGYIVSYRF